MWLFPMSNLSKGSYYLYSIYHQVRENIIRLSSRAHTWEKQCAVALVCVLSMFRWTGWRGRRRKRPNHLSQPLLLSLECGRNSSLTPLLALPTLPPPQIPLHNTLAPLSLFSLCSVALTASEADARENKSRLSALPADWSTRESHSHPVVLTHQRSRKFVRLAE